MILSPNGETIITEPPQADTVRSPMSAIRLGVAAVAITLVLIPLVGSGGDSSQFQKDFHDLLVGVPTWILNLVASSLQLVTLSASVVGVLALIVLRRYLRLLRLVVAGALAFLGLFAISNLVGNDVLYLGRPLPAIYGQGAAVPTTDQLAMLCAGVLVQSPWWSARWRRLGRIVLGCAVGARLATALAEPSTMVMALAIGFTAAQITHLLLGVPNQRPKGIDVSRVLGRFGYRLALVEVLKEPNFRGVATFRATDVSGQILFVKVVSRESWAAGLPERLYRYVRFREVGDDRPFVTVRYRVEHEALCALKAYSDGVPTPRLAVVTEFPGDAMLLAFEAVSMRPIDSLEDRERGEDLLHDAWQVVVALRSSRTVHHQLNGEFLLVDDQRHLMVVDFSAAELGASDQALAGDIAEVLAITAARLGVTTAVRAAVQAIGPVAVAEALPRLQPLALARSTRAAVKEANCLDELRAEVERITGAPTVRADDLERIKPRTLLYVLMTALGLSAIIPQLIGAGDVWSKLQSADLWWVTAALGLSLLTYFGAAIALEGSIPDRLPFGPNVGVQFATSFAGVAAPGGALALTARFLQRRGVDPALALAGVGVDTMAGVVVHFSLLGVFIAQAGTSGLAAFRFPATATLWLILGAVAIVLAMILTVRRSRALLFARVVPALRRAGHGMAETARHPFNLIELFGGSAIITMGYLLALEVSVLAFGHGPSFTSVALVYLVGSVLSSAAPTPGGIGAVEAALITGLTSTGMASDAAFSAVTLFRIATFWLPILPGWFAFTVLQRSGDL